MELVLSGSSSYLSPLSQPTQPFNIIIPGFTISQADVCCRLFTTVLLAAGSAKEIGFIIEKCPWNKVRFWWESKGKQPQPYTSVDYFHPLSTAHDENSVNYPILEIYFGIWYAAQHRLLCTVAGECGSGQVSIVLTKTAISTSTHLNYK